MAARCVLMRLTISCPSRGNTCPMTRWHGADMAFQGTCDFVAPTAASMLIPRCSQRQSICAMGAEVHRRLNKRDDYRWLQVADALLVAQSFNGIEARSLDCGQHAADETDDDKNRGGNQQVHGRNGKMDVAGLGVFGHDAEAGDIH